MDNKEILELMDYTINIIMESQNDELENHNISGYEEAWERFINAKNIIGVDKKLLYSIYSVGIMKGLETFKECMEIQMGERQRSEISKLSPN